ncbi:thioesterase II family protein [Parafrankia sp. FMc2]|uniref:thioesterase II family protein n=1 Tax=Parafrankia sp. FMc2 TaxID=3233196 RepID=UPI0034D5B11A
MKPSLTGWFSTRFRNPSARVHLYCFPYAGGGSSVFSKWPDGLGPEVEVRPVLLPGRESRISEPAYASMDELLPRLLNGLAPQLETPFVLFGHSMGALVAFELACGLLRAGLPAPSRLFLSAAGPRRGPHLTDKSRLRDPELLESLRRMNGTPPEFFDDPDLVELLLPIIRADFTLAETFQVATDVVLPVPITGLAGSVDPEARPADVGTWRAHTTRDFRLEVLPGDHFFIHDQRRVLDVLARDLGSPASG